MRHVEAEETRQNRGTVDWCPPCLLAPFTVVTAKLGGAALVDVEDDPWWVCSIMPDLADRWPGGHRVLVTCWCGHGQLIGGRVGTVYW